jgi:hypothetical protein
MRLITTYAHNMNTYKLMIKTHLYTGMKYLCITKRKGWEKYKGSGKHWLNHLKSHGCFFKTDLLFSSDNYEEFSIWCKFYSDYYDVANSKYFANAIPEYGYDNGQEVDCNFQVWINSLSECDRKSFYAYRADQARIGISNMTEDTKKSRAEKISHQAKLLWQNLTQEEKTDRIEKMRNGITSFIEDKDSESYHNWKQKLSESAKLRYNEMSEDDRANRSLLISMGRLNMTEESKNSRRLKITESFSNSGKRKEFNENMKILRLGENNPASKIIVWEGYSYTIGELRKHARKIGISWSQIVRTLDESTNEQCYRLYEQKETNYEVLTCPYCGASTNGKNKPSTFKRWHFDNCKHKGDKDEKIG